MNTGGREVRIHLRDVPSLLVKASWNRALDQLPFAPTKALFVRSRDCTANELLKEVHGIVTGRIGAVEIMGGLAVWFEDDNDATMVKMFFS